VAVRVKVTRDESGGVTKKRTLKLSPKISQQGTVRGYNNSVLCYWDTTMTLSSVVAPSQWLGQRGVLVSQGEGRVTPGYRIICRKAISFPNA